MSIDYAEVFCVAPTPLHPIPSLHVLEMHSVEALNKTHYILCITATLPTHTPQAVYGSMLHLALRY